MSVSLKKGSTLSLVKQDGSGLNRVQLGLGWDPITKKQGLFGGLFGGGGDIDLDASAIMFDERGQFVDVVYYGKKASSDGATQHSGDNLTGEGEGDDESIITDLSRVESRVKHIVLVITSYQGQTLDQVQNVYARVVDISGNHANEIVRYDLAERGASTANIIARLSRTGTGWAFTAIGQSATGRVFKDVLADAQRNL